MKKGKIVVAIFTVCVCNDNQVTESECPFNSAYMSEIALGKSKSGSIKCTLIIIYPNC